jgi:hypothetical protein
MNNLPSPKEFSSFKLEFKKAIKFEDDITEEANKLKFTLEQQQQVINKNKIPSGKISKLFDEQILNYNPKLTQIILKKHIGWDKWEDSLSVTLRDTNNIIQSIAIHRSKNFLDKNGNRQKWVKKATSKNDYSPNYVRDKAKIVFANVGIKECLLNQLLELDYVSFITDGVVKSLSTNEMFQNEIKPKLKNKILVYLVEEDTSSYETINPIKEELKGTCRVIVLTMQEFYTFFIIGEGGKDKILEPNTDFVDICNFIKDIPLIKETLKEMIEMELKNG